jgi:hypothetical protein
VVKVLAYQPDANTIYARVFDARFKERVPGDSIGEEGRDPAVMLKALEMGIGVLPVTRRVFDYWQPVFMFMQAITEEEENNLNQVGMEAEPWDDLAFP